MYYKFFSHLFFFLEFWWLFTGKSVSLIKVQSLLIFFYFYWILLTFLQLFSSKHLNFFLAFQCLFTGDSTSWIKVQSMLIFFHITFMLIWQQFQHLFNILLKCHCWFINISFIFQQLFSSKVRFNIIFTFQHLLTGESISWIKVQSLLNQRRYCNVVTLLIYIYFDNFL